MNVSSFLSIVAERQAATGARPRIVLLSNESVHSLLSELESSGGAVHAPSSSAVGAEVQMKVERNGHYCMTICGVDIHRESALSGADYHVAA